MNKIKVGIIGATGYAGCELVRLLYNHPQAEVVAMSSISYEGKPIADVYHNLRSVVNQILTDEDSVIAKSDIVFASLPHGLCEKIARKCLDNKVKLIDLGADFRLECEEDYKLWYGLTYTDQELHDKSAYCLPELHRGDVVGKEIIGNPGCYPTSIALALAPLIEGEFIELDSIIIDSKSGVTGAGRSLSQTTHFPDCNEAFSPYKIACHRHTPEIEQTLSGLAKQNVNVTFVPHLLPVNRGILSTIYAKLKDVNISDFTGYYKEFYSEERFIRIVDKGEVANIKNVRMSNYCDISVHVDSRTDRVIIVSAIDNMVKGAAGQAIQNMNIMFNLDEGMGLDNIIPICY